MNPTSATINIIKTAVGDAAYFKTEYAYIRQSMKELHKKYDKDAILFVHLGQAAGWDFCSIERVAYKQGMTSTWWTGREQKGYYMIPDDKGETITDAGPCPWNDVPMGLQTALDVDAVVEGAREIQAVRHTFQSGSKHDTKDTEVASVSTKPLPVKAHSEGGPYCCGFIHYESLGNCYVNHVKPNVLFCHIPGELDQTSLERAKDAVLAVIVSAVNEILRPQRKHSGIDESAVHS